MIYLEISIIYSIIVFISFLLHHLIVIPVIKRYISFPSLYLIIISSIIITDLLLIFIENHFSNSVLYTLLIIDSIITGILLALLVWIYSFSWCVFHLFLTILLIGLGYISPKNDLLNSRSCEAILLMVIALMHGILGFFNGFRTYMHRWIALSGMCLTFYLIVFERVEMKWKIFIHSIQSIRAFFLYSIVICIRNRTSYW